MKVYYVENQDGSLKIELDFDELEVKYLKHMLPGVQGICDWYCKGPGSEKIFQCKERMHKEWIEKLRNRKISIPAEDKEFADLIMRQEDYCDREKRMLNNELS